MQQGLQHSFASLFYNIVFYQDPYISTVEAESLISQIVTALHKIKTDNEIAFPFII